MAYLVLRFGIWMAIFTKSEEALSFYGRVSLTCLFWRLIAIARIAVRHLQRLHQIPCSKCAYFTGDYRLKCTVQPMVAMSEEAIGCRDFLYRDYPPDTLSPKGLLRLCSSERNRDRQNPCGVCMAANQCDNAKRQPMHSLYKPKFTYLK